MPELISDQERERLLQEARDARFNIEIESIKERHGRTVATLKAEIDRHLEAIDVLKQKQAEAQAILDEFMTRFPTASSGGTEAGASGEANQ